MSDEQTWTFLERPVKLWGPGPWQHEPDRIQWTSAHGYVCLMLRNLGSEGDIAIYGGPGWSGHWCGYVGLPPGHPMLSPDFDDSIEVHGGITGGGRCREESNGFHPEYRMCHVPAPGQPDELIWLGFDCNHGGYSPDDDLSPLKAGRGEACGTYRNVEYVRRQCELLAEQAAAAAREPEES